jgi:Cys-rich four helix bundle protein (predicted Tat secretion target)
MLRRTLLPVAGAATLARMPRKAAAQAAPAAAPEHDHAHHHADDAGRPYKALADSAAHCATTGQECLTHCIEMFQAGDTSLADCARSVRGLVAICRALEDLALSNSGHVPALSKVVLNVCTECEAQCRKHAAHHATCKACVDACAACADECRKVGA